MNKNGIKDYGIKIGDIFNKRTVIEVGKFKEIKDKRAKSGIRLAQASLCKCSCEKSEPKLVKNSTLVKGSSKGCIRCGNKKCNRYDLSGVYGVGYTFKNERFYFDLEDYEKIKEYCWHMHWDTHNGYLRTFLKKDGNKNIYEFLHRIILKEIPDERVVDHINRKTFDNRKSNLRLVSRSVNSMNAKRKDTKYIQGVTFNKIEKKFKSCIRFDKKQINLGTYKELNDAIKSRLEAELRYFGVEFAPNIDLFDKYGVGSNE